jgi:hypothetical protein
VCAIGSIEGDGLRADDRVIPWSELAYVVARRLPPDPPWEKAMVVDLVPAAGPPVRLTASTRIDCTRLPDGAAPTAKENWRRLVTLAADRNPAFRVERTSVAFFEGGEAPMFPAWKRFLDYDARYGATT